MSLEFASNMIAPESVRCIGLPMLPYSFGHHLRLQSIASPFLFGGLPSYEDLIAAAFICAHTEEENVRLMRSRCRAWLYLKVWGLLAGKFDIIESMAAMSQHVRTATEIPATKTQRGAKVKTLFSSWETRLYSFLRSIGYGHTEAMNVPMQVAHLLFCANLEERGAVEFKTDADFIIEDALTRACEAAEQSERSMSA